MYGAGCRCILQRLAYTLRRGITMAVFMVIFYYSSIAMMTGNSMSHSQFYYIRALAGFT